MAREKLSLCAKANFINLLLCDVLRFMRSHICFLFSEKSRVVENQGGNSRVQRSNSEGQYLY